MARLPTYAETLGAHRASRVEVAEAVRRGELRSLNTRAYVLPSGRVVSNRAMQQIAMSVRYGASTLEERAQIRYEGTGLRSDYATMSHFIRSLQFRDRRFKSMTFHQVRADPRFREIWGDWKAVQHRSPAKRLAFLKAHKLISKEKGTWTT